MTDLNTPLSGKLEVVVTYLAMSAIHISCGAKILGKPEIYREDAAEPPPKSDTITVTLPKPVKPKSSDKSYRFVLDYEKYRISEEVFGDFNAEVILAGNGLCFRAREDAKAWLDAMKNALRD